jgi:hypothetical protein
MFQKSGLQVRLLGGFGHFWQSAENLSLREVDVF